MKLSDASEPFSQNIKINEILFLSDIEYFTEEIKKELYNCLKNKKIKLVVFIGDILSFLTNYQDSIKLLNHCGMLFDMFFEYSDEELEKIDKFLASRKIIGKIISDYLQKQANNNKLINSSVKNYINFVNYCKRKNINILYYSGNHDFIMDGNEIRYYSYYIPFFNKLWKYNNLYIPRDDLELIRLNKDLFIIGLHTHSDELNCNEYPKIK